MVHCCRFLGLKGSVPMTSTGAHAYPCISLLSVGCVLTVRHTQLTAVCECVWEMGVRPGRAVFLPLSATLLMSTPCSVAMKPSTENTTKPAKKLVPLLIIARINASLQKKKKKNCDERRIENEKNSNWCCEQRDRKREPYQHAVTWALCELLKIATGSRKDGEWMESSNYSESYCCFAVGRYRTERTTTILSLHNTDHNLITLNRIAYGILIDSNHKQKEITFCYVCVCVCVQSAPVMGNQSWGNG